MSTVEDEFDKYLHNFLFKNVTSKSAKYFPIDTNNLILHSIKEKFPFLGSNPYNTMSANVHNITEEDYLQLGLIYLSFKENFEKKYKYDFMFIATLSNEQLEEYIRLKECIQELGYQLRLKLAVTSSHYYSKI